MMKLLRFVLLFVFCAFGVSAQNPIINHLTPDHIPAGSNSFTLTVVGVNLTFLTVYWDNVALSTTTVTDHLLTAIVPVGDINAIGTHAVTVGASPKSNVAPFNVLTPLAIVNSYTPTLFTAGQDTLVTVYGENYASNFTILFDWQAIPTTFISPEILQGIVPGSIIGLNVPHYVYVYSGPFQGGSVTMVVPPQINIGTISLSDPVLNFQNANVVRDTGGTITLGTPWFTITGAFAADFTMQQGSCSDGLVLLPSAICQFTINATPSGATTETVTLTVYSDASNSPQFAQLTVTGTNTKTIQVAPTSLSFGSVALATTSALTTSVSATIGSFTLSTPFDTLSGSGDFSVTGGTCVNGGTVPCTVTVTFAPTVAGSKNGTLTINSGADNIVSVALSGIGGSISSQTARYVDFAAGSDTYDGTAKTHTSGTVGPWKSSPYMQVNSTCSDNGGTHFGYTHIAGQQVIFKGGVTWPAACFGMNIMAGGISGTPDYYGVDLTYFSGGSFTRPIFDLANTSPNPTGACLGGGRNVICVKASFVTLDNLEVKRQFITGGHSGPASGFDCGVYFNGVSNGLVQNSFFHDWVSDTANINAGWSNCAGGLGQNGGGYVADNVTVSGQNSMDLTRNVQVSFGGCFQNPSEAKNSICSYVGQGSVGFSSVHDSQFYNLSNAGAISPYTNGIHTNVIHDTFPGGGRSVYNNLVHDNAVGEVIGMCPTTNVFNNVMWNNSGAGADILVDTGVNACTVNSSTVANIYNNTVDCSNGQSCLRVIRAGVTIGTVNDRNNHWVTDRSPTSFEATITTLNQTPNTTMSTATATAQGYVVANKYQPTSGGSTIGAGVNLTSLCSGSLAALCLSTTAGNLFVPTARPNAAFDTGAYFFSGASPSITVRSPIAFGSAVVGNTSSPVTVTVTNVGGVSEILSTPFFTITTGNSGDFAHTGGSCANGGTIVAGGSCTWIGTFTPSSVAAESSLLTIQGTVNTTASLTGTGTAVHAVQLSWGPSSSASIVGYNVRRAIAGGTFGSPLNGGTPINALTYTDTTVSHGTTYVYGLTTVGGPPSWPSGTESAIVLSNQVTP